MKRTHKEGLSTHWKKGNNLGSNLFN